MTVGILEDGVITEYWFKEGTTLSDLVKKSEGLSAYEIAVQDGYEGTEEEWLASLNGESAYQIAVENGYTGTEQEWLASLKANFGSFKTLEYNASGPQITASADTTQDIYLMPNAASDPTGQIMWITVDNGENANPRYTWTNLGETDIVAFATGELLSATSIVNDLTTGGATNVLSAEQGKKLNSLVNEYNISTQQQNTTAPQESDRYDTNIFTLKEAITQVPAAYRRGGLKLTFNSSTSIVETWTLNSNTWTTHPEYFSEITKWKRCDSEYVNTIYAQLDGISSIFYLTGWGANSSVASKQKLILIPSHKYRVTFLNKPWSITGVGAGSNIFEIEYYLNGTRYSVNSILRSAKVIDKYLEFVATEADYYNICIMAADGVRVGVKFEDITNYAESLLTSVNLLNKNDENVALGYYVYQGNFEQNADINTTGYIPVKPNTTYSLLKLGANSNSSSRFLCYYDINMKYLSAGSDYAKLVTTPNNCYYMRISYVNTNTSWDDAQVTEGGRLSQISYEEIVNPDLIKKIPVASFNTLSSFRNSGSLSQNSVLKLPLTFVSKNVELSAEIGGSFSEVNIGVGTSPYVNQESYVKVTQTQLSFYLNGTLTTTVDHGLTIGNLTYVSIRTPIKPNSYDNQVAKITIYSNGNTYTTNQVFDGIGDGYIKNLSSNTISVSLSVFPCDLDKPVWLFGDSYMGWSNPARWVAQAVKDDNNSFMVSAYPGGTSSDVMNAFENLMSVGLPKIALWTLGMNDAADTDNTPNLSWVTNVSLFIHICIDKGITPVLATVPSIPTKNHEGKNTWVRNSGYRYVDFAHAVEAQSDGTWGTGYLSGDGVHPTEKGAKTLYARVLIDMPEIANQI